MDAVDRQRTGAIGSRCKNMPRQISDSRPIRIGRRQLLLTERNPEECFLATPLQARQDYQETVGVAPLGIRLSALAFLRGGCRTLGVRTGVSDFFLDIPYKFSLRTNDGDRFQHSDPACGSLLVRRYQSKWTLLGN